MPMIYSSDPHRCPQWSL